jgi:hypothetical protein
MGCAGTADSVGGKQPVAHLMGIHPHYALQLHAQPCHTDVCWTPR